MGAQKVVVFSRKRAHANMPTRAHLQQLRNSTLLSLSLLLCAMRGSQYFNIAVIRVPCSTVSAARVAAAKTSITKRQRNPMSTVKETKAKARLAKGGKAADEASTTKKVAPTRESIKRQPTERRPPLDASVPQLRILSWNVNGLRALLSKGNGTHVSVVQAMYEVCGIETICCRVHSCCCALCGLNQCQ